MGLHPAGDEVRRSRFHRLQNPLQPHQGCPLSQRGFRGCPTLLCRGFFLACTGVYVASALAGWDNYNAVCLAAEPVINRCQLYRVFTAPMLHLGLLHIGFNMMALLPMGALMERTLGSIYLLWLVQIIMALSGVIYAAIALGAGQLHPGLLRQCAVGFSGVLFGLIVVETHLDRGGSGAQRSIFGLLSVPRAAYPWALLAVWTLLVPQASFLGHLSGLLVGQLHAWGLLRWAMPSAGTVHAIERSALLGGWASTASAFVAYTGRGGSDGESSLPVSTPAAAGEGWLQIRGWFQAFRSSWVPSFQGYSSLRSEAPPDDGGAGASGSGQGGRTAAAAAAPSATVVGGAPTELDPKAAAAAAAQARVAQAAPGRPPAQPAASSTLPR